MSSANELEEVPKVKLSPDIIRDNMLKQIRKNFFCTTPEVLTNKQLQHLQQSILSCKYLAVNNLNSDFISTKGFSVVFKRSEIPTLKKQFPFFSDYIELALDPYCNAFYINPLLLINNSKVNPHIDRSLRSYYKNVEVPLIVSVLYVQVPEDMTGGELYLTHNKKRVGEIKPQLNTLLYFQGHLMHSVKEMQGSTNRLSLVCEQYHLEEDELEQIPDFTIESRNLKNVKNNSSYQKY